MTVSVTDFLDWAKYLYVHAFRAIYDAHLAYVIRTFRRLGVAVADVEDAAHDLFVVVHRRLGDYDANRPIRPWLFGIAYRIAGHYFDRQNARSAIAAIPNTLERAAGATQELLCGERDLIIKALATLDLDQRAICVLHDIECQTGPEIADQLGIPVNTVYSRLRLGREKLAAAVTQLEGVSP